MSLLLLLFGRTDYMQGLINGQNILIFACLFVGPNAIFEMLSSTLITGAVGSVLCRARLVPEAANDKDKED